MSLRTVLLIGGSGFIGRSLARRLAGLGVRVIVPTRRLVHGSPLAVLPTADVVQADVSDTGELCRLMSDVDAVVNLVGVLHSESDAPYGPGFACAHVELPRTIVAAARLSEVPRLVHISAIGASNQAPSEYLRSKADGEAVVRAAGEHIAWTIFRPSVVFGPEDSFLNLFARLSCVPVLPLGGAGARFQPVFVEDVVSAIVHALQHQAGVGEVIELAGPKRYTLAELVAFVARLRQRRVCILPLPERLAMLQAACMEHLPGPLMSRDNVRSMRCDSVAHGEPMPFGLPATALEAIAPQWLAPESGARCVFDDFRRRARRGG